MNLFHRVKEDLYKYLLSFIFLSFVYSSYNPSKNIYNDIVTLDSSKSTIGICFFNNEEIKHSITYQNWISNNLYMASSIIPITNESDFSIGYNMNMGYKIDYNNKNFKNLILSIGYNRLRFDNFNNNIKALNFDLNTTIKINNIFMISTFGISETENYYNNISLEFMKIINKNFIFKVGVKIRDFSNEGTVSIPFITLKYSL